MVSLSGGADVSSTVIEGFSALVLTRPIGRMRPLEVSRPPRYDLCYRNADKGEDMETIELIKHPTEKRYRFEAIVDGESIRLTALQLLTFGQFKRATFTQSEILLARRTQAEWEDELRELLRGLRTIKTPDKEASA